MNPLRSQLMGTKLQTSNASPEIPLPKKTSRKYRSNFGLKNWSCDRRHETNFRNSSFHLILCTRHVRVPDFVSFRLVPFNFPVPETYAYLSGTWKLKLAKPKVEGTPTVGLISTKRSLYRGDSLVPIHHLAVPGRKLWMGTTETFLVYQKIIFELVVPSQP